MLKRWFGKRKQANEPLVLDKNKLPRHIAIIMDGNGRWAQKRGLPRTLGHRAGVDSLREVVRAASNIGVKALTAYAFSTENWKRPEEEVNLLMNLLSEYLDSEIEELHRENIKIRFIGKIEELASGLRKKMQEAQEYTEKNTGMIFSLAVNYGGRAEILQCVQVIADKVAKGEMKREQITEEAINQHLYTADLPELDLLIRPSGDFRISNFLLWQAAYAEFWFTDIHWPDFTPTHLQQAILDYQRRERRFGGLKK